MEKNLRKSAISIILFQRNAFLCISIFLLIAVIALTIVSLKKETITIFEPPKEKFDLKAAEKEALYVTHLILNRTPRNWDAQDDALFSWVAPDYAIPLKAKLEEGKRKILEHQKIYEWEARESNVEIVNPQTLRVYIKGVLQVFIPKNENSKQLVEKQKVKYLLVFTSDHGKLLLKSFTKEKL